jgi:hypothetical protein
MSSCFGRSSCNAATPKGSIKFAVWTFRGTFSEESKIRVSATLPSLESVNWVVEYFFPFLPCPSNRNFPTSQPFWASKDRPVSDVWWEGNDGFRRWYVVIACLRIIFWASIGGRPLQDVSVVVTKINWEVGGNGRGGLKWLWLDVVLKSFSTRWCSKAMDVLGHSLR